jgi:hypothetical protein
VARRAILLPKPLWVELADAVFFDEFGSGSPSGSRPRVVDSRPRSFYVLKFPEF